MALTLVSFGCDGDAPLDTGIGAAEQAECLEDGGLDPDVEFHPEPLGDDVCRCIADSDDRGYEPGTDQSDAPIADPDPRLEDTSEIDHWHTQMRHTRCGCCHNGAYEGSGSYIWDLAYDPIWTDTVTDDRLRQMAGLNEDKGQSIQFPDQEAFRAFVEAEIARREAVR